MPKGICTTDGDCAVTAHFRISSQRMAEGRCAGCGRKINDGGIVYMMHNACGEVFEQLSNSSDVKTAHHQTCDALRADALAGKRWTMNMSEDEAF